MLESLSKQLSISKSLQTSIVVWVNNNNNKIDNYQSSFIAAIENKENNHHKSDIWHIQFMSFHFKKLPLFITF